jgi:protein-disulfide isomerase
MNNVSRLLLVVVFFLAANGGFAQRARQRGPSRPPAKSTATEPDAPPTEPAPSRVVAPVSTPPQLLAVINGQNITSADLDPKVREEVEGLEANIAEARRQVLELQINTLLLESEAAKRKVTTQRLYDTEVVAKIGEPTAAEVNKFIQDNRGQLDDSDPATREQVVAYLRSEREAKISGELVKRLRTSNAVVQGVNVNTLGLAPTAVVATVAGRPITAALLNERLKPILYRLQLDSYLIAKEALDQKINDLLLLAEATRRNIPPEEMVRKEVTEKIHEPTEAEITKFYADNNARISGQLDSLRPQISTYLREQERLRVERAFADTLRAGAAIRVLISEPEPPVQAISVDDDPSRGDANAAVTIVEFTDFQCPSCAAMHPILEDALKSYGNKVRLVVRDFPLAGHANARKAAEAANAANAQGKFFEYTALLFKHQDALDVPSLKKYATEIGLDRARFDAALDGRKYAPEIKHDIDDGDIYGVNSTPTIFVNGVALKSLSAEALRAAIDQALSRAGVR